MKVLKSFEALSTLSKPVSVTIGNFDGVHLGHQAILKRLKEVSLLAKGSCAVVTFENHPSHILRPQHAVESIYTVSHKIRLIEEFGIDYLILIPFTKEFAQQSANDFLSSLRCHYPFTSLVLGYDASFGKNKEGNYQTVKEFSMTHQFNVEYLSKRQIDDIVISSSQIRKMLRSGDITGASQLLGRPYSVFSKIERGLQQGAVIGFPTVNLNIEGLCHLPLGVYIVWALLDHNKIPAVANLGIAPTLKNIHTPLLEVHFLKEVGDLKVDELEIEFCKFVRTEMKFSTKENLITQIKQDVHTAKSYFEN